MPQRAKGLSDWLEAIEAMHPASIELGLDRMARVLARLDYHTKAKVITVGGTN